MIASENCIFSLTYLKTNQLAWIVITDSAPQEVEERTSITTFSHAKELAAIIDVWRIGA